MVIREAYTIQYIINYNFDDILNKHKDRTSEPTLTVPKKDVILVLPYLGFHSDAITRRFKSCVHKFYGFVNLRVVFSEHSQNYVFLSLQRSFQPLVEIEGCLQSQAGLRCFLYW